MAFLLPLLGSVVGNLLGSGYGGLITGGTYNKGKRLLKKTKASKKVYLKKKKVLKRKIESIKLKAYFKALHDVWEEKYKPLGVSFRNTMKALKKKWNGQSFSMQKQKATEIISNVSEKHDIEPEKVIAMTTVLNGVADQYSNQNPLAVHSLPKSSITIEDITEKVVPKMIKETSKSVGPLLLEYHPELSKSEVTEIKKEVAPLLLEYHPDMSNAEKKDLKNKVETVIESVAPEVTSNEHLSDTLFGDLFGSGYKIKKKHKLHGGNYRKIIKGALRHYGM